MHGADGAGVSIGALVAHHSDTFHRKQDGERLPDLLVEPGSFDFCYDNVVGFLQQRNTFRCDFAENAYGEAWPGKRLALQDVFWHLEVAADAANFVLEEIA